MDNQDKTWTAFLKTQSWQQSYDVYDAFVQAAKWLVPKEKALHDVTKFIEAGGGQPDPVEIRAVLDTAYEAVATKSPTLNAPKEPPPPPKPRVLPTVIIPDGITTLSESATKLFEAIAPTKELFIRGGKVTQLTVNDKGIRVFESVTSTAACSLFEKYTRFEKETRSEKQPVPRRAPALLTKDLADRYLQAEQRLLLPTVAGLVHCPVLIETNGKLRLLESGYDEATKLFVSGKVNLPEVTLDDAIEILKDLFNDFDFHSPGDRSRALASLITPAMKFGNLITDYIPIDVAEADKIGAGKTYRQQVTAAIYGETLQIVTKKEGSGVGSLEEAFGTCLAHGRPFIQFDNVRGKLQSQMLESFVTANAPIQARPAFSEIVLIDPSKFVIYINSNGYQANADLSSRSSIIRIKKRENVAFKNLLGFVEKNQPLLLACVYEVIKEWHRRGKKKTGDLRHRFRGWCQPLDWIVQELFHEAPLMDGHADAQKRVASASYSFLRDVAIRVEEERSLKAPLRASEILGLCRRHNITIPGLSNDHRNDDAAASMAVGKAMGELFEGEQNETAIEGYVITRKIEKATREANKEFSSKTYLFRREVAA